MPLRWQPQADPGRDDESLWTDTRVAGGGSPLPFYFSAKLLHDYFGPGTPLYATDTGAAGVAALASADHVLVVNERAASTTVAVGGNTRTLGPWEVALF